VSEFAGLYLCLLSHWKGKYSCFVDFQKAFYTIKQNVIMDGAKIISSWALVSLVSWLLVSPLHKVLEDHLLVVVVVQSFPAMQPLDLYRLYPYAVFRPSLHTYSSDWRVFPLLLLPREDAMSLWWTCVLRGYNCTVAVTPEDFQLSTSLASIHAICCPKMIA